MKMFMTTAAIVAALTMPALAQTESTKGEAAGTSKSTTMGDKSPNAKGSDATGMKSGASTAMQPELRKDLQGKSGASDNAASGGTTGSSPNSASGGADNANSSGASGGSSGDGGGAGGAAGNGK
jgi:hypothetical protein